MEFLKGKLVKALADYFENDCRRIAHALEVMQEAEIMARDIDTLDREVLLAASLLHDVGIKISEAKLGCNNGKTQEKYGPPEASRILKALRFPVAKARKVCRMVGNHHSPVRYPYPELKILRQADRIVNRRKVTHGNNQRH